MNRLVVSLAVLAAGLAMGARASAQTAPLQLDYEAPAGCPDAGAFAAEVRARAPRSASLDGRSVEVRIAAIAASAPHAATFEGRVVIVDDGGTTPSRAVTGDSCGEVVRALALAVAMTFDPADVVPPVVIVPVAAPQPARPERPAETPLPARERLHVTAGVTGGAGSGVGPLVAPAFGLYGELAYGSLSGRLGAARAVSALVERGAGSARFARTTATLDGCPFRWQPGTNVAVVPCLAFEIGSLTSTGQSTIDPEASSRLWVATGLAGRLVWEPFEVLALGLEGRAEVPLTRDSFYFRPSEDVFEAPIVAFSAGATAGVRFR